MHAAIQLAHSPRYLLHGNRVACLSPVPRPPDHTEGLGTRLGLFLFTSVHNWHWPQHVIAGHWDQAGKLLSPSSVTYHLHVLQAYLSGSSVVMSGQSLVMRDPGEENKEQ